jgi:tetratricopeptide (TPR) repeat protein
MKLGALGAWLVWLLLQPGAVRHPTLDGLDPLVAAQLRDERLRLEGVVRAGRPSAEDYGRLARHYHAYGMVAAAEDAYRAAEALDGRDFRWTYLRALILSDDNRPEEAARAYRESFAKAGYYPALVRLAAVEIQLGQSAEPELSLARRHAPDDPALLSVLGEEALAHGHAAEAAAFLEKALAAQPRANRLHYPLAMAYRALGRPDAARAELARSGTAGIQPKDPLLDEVLALRRGAQVFLLEGQRAATAGDDEAAAAAYRQALTADPSHAQAREELVLALLALGRLADAEVAALEAARDPAFCARLLTRLDRAPASLGEVAHALTRRLSEAGCPSAE